MNITDLIVPGVFLAREQPDTEREISTFPDYFSNLRSLDDPKPPVEGALGLLGALSENFEDDEISDLPNPLETGEFESLLDDPGTPKVDEKAVTLLPNMEEVSEPVFFHSANRKNRFFEHPSQIEPTSNINPSLNAPFLRVTSRSAGLEHSASERETIRPAPQLARPVHIPPAQISANAPHLWLADGSEQIVGKEFLQPADKFANPIAHLPENGQPNKNHPYTVRHSSTPELHAQTKTKGQSSNSSPPTILNNKDFASSNSIALRPELAPVAPIALQPNPKGAATAPKQTEKDASLEPLKEGTKSLELSSERSFALVSPPPESLVSKAGFVETKGLRNPPTEFTNRDTQKSFIPKLSLPQPVTSWRQTPLDIPVQISQSEMIIERSA